MLVNDLEVLLMDEFLGVLDVMIRDSMRKELIKIWKVINKIIIFIIYSVLEVVYLVDRVVLLKEGKIEILEIIDILRFRNIKSVNL